MDPQDVQNLLRSSQGFSALRQRGMETVLDERNRQRLAQEKTAVRIANLKAAATTAQEKERVRKLEAAAKVEAKDLEVQNKREAAKTLADSKIALENRKAELTANAKQLSPEELQIQGLDIQEQELDIQKKQADLEKGVSGELTADQKIDNALAQNKFEMQQRAEQRGIDEATIANQDFILNPETPRVQAEAQANRENAKVDGDQVFYNEVDAPWLGRNTDVMNVWQIPSSKMYRGQKLTPPMLVQIAKERGVTLQELITALKGQ